MNANIDTRPMSRLFKALSDETRLRIVALLSLGELCVCHLEAGLDLPQPTVSRQLAILRSAGVVDSRRQGSWIYYRLAPQIDASCQKQLDDLIAAFSQQTTLRQEIERVLKSTGPGACR